MSFTCARGVTNPEDVVNDKWSEGQEKVKFPKKTLFPCVGNIKFLFKII